MAVGEWGDRPLLLAVDADARLLGRIEGELQRAFGADFRVRGSCFRRRGEDTAGGRQRQERVAVVLVDDSLSDDARAEIFETVESAPKRTAHPRAVGRLGPS